MDTTYVALSSEERKLLVAVLESALKNKLIEAHRTRRPTYRVDVVREEELLGHVLDKLRHN